ncbi:MAG TPA: histidine phosphatase family protein [Burkholderiaceae bacterium]|nr:histidine phosphatase family protein [Burkholderiaceae bacterium]
MSLLLVRHGETALNATRVLQPADTPLSARGIAQAEAIARRLGPGRDGTRAAAIVSSDLPRALRTAQAIAAATGLPIATTPLLHERNFGALRGRPYDTLAFNPLTMRDAPPGGESGDAFEQRVALAFAHIVQLRGELAGDLIVVSHGLVIGRMLACHVSLPEGWAAPAHMGNTSLSIVDAAPPHLAALLNCTRHLADAISDDERALAGG